MIIRQIRVPAFHPVNAKQRVRGFSGLSGSARRKTGVPINIEKIDFLYKRIRENLNNPSNPRTRLSPCKS
jgi:hypothetical protein